MPTHYGGYIRMCIHLCVYTHTYTERDIHIETHRHRRGGRHQDRHRHTSFDLLLAQSTVCVCVDGKKNKKTKSNQFRSAP